MAWNYPLTLESKGPFWACVVVVQSLNQFRLFATHGTPGFSVRHHLPYRAQTRVH